LVRSSTQLTTRVMDVFFRGGTFASRHHHFDIRVSLEVCYDPRFPDLVEDEDSEGGESRVLKQLRRREIEKQRLDATKDQKQGLANF
jgi:hypothetical protein